MKDRGAKLPRMKFPKEEFGSLEYPCKGVTRQRSLPEKSPWIFMPKGMKI